MIIFQVHEYYVIFVFLQNYAFYLPCVKKKRNQMYKLIHGFGSGCVNISRETIPVLQVCHYLILTTSYCLFLQ